MKAGRDGLATFLPSQAIVGLRSGRDGLNTFSAPGQDGLATLRRRDAQSVKKKMCATLCPKGVRASRVSCPFAAVHLSIIVVSLKISSTLKFAFVIKLSL
jgi:hypothetical protein